MIDHAYESDDIKNSDACMHPTEGWRGSPWCKLPAILHALTTGGERGAAGSCRCGASHVEWEGGEGLGCQREAGLRNARERRERVKNCMHKDGLFHHAAVFEMVSNPALT